MLNDPAVAAEIAALYEQYEAALVSNDVAQLVHFFWDSEHALRFGVAENLYGAKEIEAFRKSRPVIDLARQTSNLRIVTFGEDCAIVTLEFLRTVQGVSRHGRQSQVWRKFPEGWKIVSAHVSLVPPVYMDLAAAMVGLSIPDSLREGVRVNIERSSGIARPLLEFALNELTETAEVFEP